MKNYKKIDLWAGCTIEQAIRILKNYKDKGILVCCDFNDMILYSDMVELDVTYKQITGKTKAEHDKSLEDWRNDYNKKEKEFKETIPELTKMWIEKGEDILSEDKWDYWTEIVPIRLGDLYRGMELGCCLDIVKILNNGRTLEEANKEINSQGHSGMSFGLVCAMVKEFCERGEEFVDYIG